MFLRAVACLCVVCLIAMTGATWVLVEERRDRSCESRTAVVEAFDVYTDALIAAGEGRPRTADEEQERRESIAAFRADLDLRLAPLTTGC